MANQEHVVLLEQGVDAWNAWRQEHRNTVPNLREADLSDADLRRADLNIADLSGADLFRADLIGADLSDANLQEAVILTQSQLNKACGNERTELPQGLSIKPCE